MENEKYVDEAADVKCGTLNTRYGSNTLKIIDEIIGSAKLINDHGLSSG